MSPDSNNPVLASSNQAEVPNLKSEGDERWISRIHDDNPSFNITVADENSFIKIVNVQNTSNVATIIVQVYDEEGKKV